MVGTEAKKVGTVEEVRMAMEGRVAVEGREGRDQGKKIEN